MRKINWNESETNTLSHTSNKTMFGFQTKHKLRKFSNNEFSFLYQESSEIKVDNIVALNLFV